MNKCKKKYTVEAFTLSEVLITLGIIGTVAAMTLPTLIAKINDTVNSNAANVFNAKLIKGLNLTKTAGDLNNTYNSTYDFLVNGLGKNLKISKVCDSSHIRDCIPYDKIKYEKSDKTEETIYVKDINTASKLKLPAPFTDTAAFVLADGTCVIAAYNTKCIDDPDKADTTINSCLAGIYDTNGAKKPNKFGAKLEKNKAVFTGDLRGFNGAKLGNCSGVIGDVCLITARMGGSASLYNDILLAIQEIEPNYNMPTFYRPLTGSTSYNDYWQLSADYCSKIHNSKLPTMEQLGQIAEALYYDSSDKNKTIGAKDNVLDITMKNKDIFYATFNLPSNLGWFLFWSSEEAGATGAWMRNFRLNYTDVLNYDRDDSRRSFFCQED